MTLTASPRCMLRSQMLESPMLTDASSVLLKSSSSLSTQVLACLACPLVYRLKRARRRTTRAPYACSASSMRGALALTLAAALAVGDARTLGVGNFNKLVLAEVRS